MNAIEMTDYIANTFPEVETGEAYGYTFFYYCSERKMPFATLIAADTEYDRVSNLDRPGVYRLNIGVSKATFQALFGADKVDASGCDYTALDVIMPHPDYAKEHFICVLSPGAATEAQVRDLLAEAYEIAAKRYARQGKTESG